MALAFDTTNDTIRPSEGWRRDKDAEIILAENGMGWDYLTIQLNLIDRKQSLRNNARMAALDAEEADVYAADMKRGDIFPALVLFPQPDGTYVIASGNHRAYAAEKAGRKRVDAYVVLTNDVSMRSLLTQTFNKRHGIRPPQADRLAQAVKWMRETGRAPSYVALRFGVSEASLSRVQREERRERRFRSAGVRTEPLRKRTQEILDRIPNDPALVQASSLILDTKLPDDQVQQLVERVTEQRSESAQIAAVERFAERDDVKQRRVEVATSGGRRRVPPSPAHRLMTALKQVDRLLKDHPSRLTMKLTNDDDHQQAVALAASIWERLDGLPESIV